MIGCHGSCEKYKKGKEKHEKEKALKNANREIYNAMFSNYINNATKDKKKKRFPRTVRHYG